MRAEITEKYLYRCYEDLAILYEKHNNIYVLLEDIFADIFSIMMNEDEDQEYIIQKIMEIYDVDYDTISTDFKEFSEQINSLLAIQNVGHQANVDIDNYDETENYIFDLMAERQIPFTATIEITDRCNLKCSHCYRSQETLNLWNVENFEKALQELKTLGTLHIVLAGSEPMMHPDIVRIIELIGQYGFVLTVQSNVTMLNDSILSALKKCSVKMVFVSLYTDDAAIHEQITGVKGSYEKTIYAIKTLTENGFTVRASVSIFDVNREQVYAVNSLCNKLGIHAGYNFKIIPAIAPEKDTVSLNAFDEERMYEYITSPELRLFEGAIKRSREKEQIIPERYCSTGIRSITITYDLKVVICNAFRKECGSLLDSSISEIWNESAELTRWREKISKVNSKCASCDAFQYCEPCPAHYYTQTGNDDEIDAITCSYGKMFKNVCDRARMI